MRRDQDLLSALKGWRDVTLQYGKVRSMPLQAFGARNVGQRNMEVLVVVSGYHCE